MELKRKQGGSRDAWFADLRHTVEMLRCVDLIVDTDTERLVAVSSTVEALMDGVAPEHVDDLLAVGLVARPEVDEIRRRVQSYRRLPPPSGESSESAHAWDAQLTVHAPGKATQVLDVHLAYNRRPAWQAEVLMVAFEASDHHADPVALTTPSRHGYYVVYDQFMRMVAVDPMLADLGHDPDALVGASATAWVHPADLPEANSRIHQVLFGQARIVTFTSRVSDAHGGWIAMDCEARPLHTNGALQVIICSRLSATNLAPIPFGELTRRETAVAKGVFDGLRPNQIAARDGVSVNTVRNQLVSVYRKLSITGARELVSRYHPPPSP